MVRRICLYALAGIAALVLALSLPACGGYGHRQKDKTQTSGGY
jgi:hypothetical protein